ncbi:MAG: glycosyltransferase family 4 protein [Bacteroidales bacterium]
MKLLILSTKLPYPTKDGGAIATMNLATGLARTGVNVTILSLNTKKHYFPPEKIPESLKKLINFRTVYHNTSIRPLKAFRNLLFSRKPYIAERFYSRKFSLQLRNLLSSENYSFVQMEGPYFSEYIPVIRETSAAIVSLRAHNVEHEIWERRWRTEKNLVTRSYLKNLAKRIRKLEAKIIGDVDLLISISEKDRKGLLSLSESESIQSITIPTGLDLSQYIAGLPLYDNAICFIGALDWTPNQEGIRWMIKMVLPHLIRQNNQIAFHIAGRNASPGFKRELHHTNIVFHGETEDAKAFMSNYKVMVVPLLTGSGIRIKILEGMAMGLCVVTTTIGAEGIPVEKEKQLLIEDHPKLFAQKIRMILDNQQMAENISIEARRVIEEKFDTFAIASDLKNIYKKMI